MAYLSTNAKCFICGKNLGLLTGSGRWELADGKWICVKCAKKHKMNTIAIKRLTSKEVMNNNPNVLSNDLEGIVYNLKGRKGRSLQVYEDKCVISTNVSMGSFIAGNASAGDKIIYYADVIGVQFKKSALQIGYLQLETASSIMNNLESNSSNENTFPFDHHNLSNEKMEEVRDYVLKQVEKHKVKESSVSSADEILKFKKLCDEGIITEEEFEQKKKQLLDL